MLLLGLPPLPAADGGQAEDDAADQAGAVGAQPFKDAFALFVFVEWIVYCHAVAAIPPRPEAGDP
ncbi:hypothetical protein GCM10027191_12070 [Novilysobacter erysipheiresistens]